MLTEAELRREAGATGFQVDVLEKTMRLLELLELLRSHPYLRSRLALKGGTALNLFVLDLPRLSVDVDLNYVGSAEREGMLEERPRVEEAIAAVCSRLGLHVRRTPTDHAGGKWRLSYTTVFGRPGTLELDMNFMLRQPLWPIRVQDSLPVGSFSAREIPVLDPHELAAGKLSALFARGAGRDLFDARELLTKVPLEEDRLRLGFVVYGGANRRDWRRVTPEDLRLDPAEVQRSLLPMLNRHHRPRAEDLESWTTALVQGCRDAVHRVLPLAAAEVEFLEALNDHGQIVPELLTEDTPMRERIARHPGLRWKALNVQRLRDGDDR